jgi:hypothetical protein
MTVPAERFTINQIDFTQPLDDWKTRLADYGRRRHLSYTLDFDTRVHRVRTRAARNHALSGQTKNKSPFGAPKPTKGRPEDPKRDTMSLIRPFEKSQIFS